MILNTGHTDPPSAELIKHTDNATNESVELDNIVPLPKQDLLQIGSRFSSQVRDYAAAIDLINETREAIRISETRSEQLEQELKRVINEASEAIKSLNARASATEGELEQARNYISQLEIRVSESELRASEAEAWLVKLHDSVVSSFGNIEQSKPEKKQ